YRRNLLSSGVYAVYPDGAVAAYMTYSDWGVPLTETKTDMSHAGLEGMADYGGYIAKKVRQLE
ncbi:MAG: hypothetical protein LBK98_02890, partial [Peptococcaceae bacterium]|nr:hypothetical protein [Peptococcaceae bacterium]